MTRNLVLFISLFNLNGYQFHTDSYRPKSDFFLLPSSKTSSIDTSIDEPAKQDTTFTLKIENEKRMMDDNLKAKLIKEIKSAIAGHHLQKPYKVAMAFTRGAHDVETFLFGEQIFYTLAENGYSIKGKPLELPEVSPNPVPQIKVIDKVIYVVMSKM